MAELAHVNRFSTAGELTASYDVRARRAAKATLLTHHGHGTIGFDWIVCATS
jgi:hypothetical protein